MMGWVIFGVTLIAAAGWIGWRISAGRSLATVAERARRELTTRTNELFSFQELSYTLFQSFEQDAIAQPAVQCVTRFLNADGALLALTLDGESPLRIAAADGTLELLREKEFPKEGAGLITVAMNQNHVEIAHTEGTERPELVSGVEVEVAAVVPLRTHGTTFGVLAAVRDTAVPFSSEELRQITTVATHASIAIENSRLFELVKTGKEQWEATFDALANGMAVLDGEGRIRRANRTLAQMVDQSIPEVVGTQLCGTLLANSTELEEHFACARRHEACQPITVRSPLKGRTLKISAAGMPGAGGGWLVVQIEDVTESEALEAQLIQQEKMAAVGQLVSGVAHELNNPLSSIAGLAEFLLHREQPIEGGSKHLKLIHEQAERAGRIVRNLLAFARRGPAEADYLDLNEIVRQTTQLISYELTLREIELETDLARELPPVFGDRHELQQVVLNLLTNAIQAVDGNQAEEPRTVRLVTMEDSGSTVLLVSDTGPGIPADLASQIFTPFFTTKSQDQGTGLGLSISYRIVTSHGGQLELSESGPDGTTFLVRLPARPSAEASPVSEEGDTRSTT